MQPLPLRDIHQKCSATFGELNGKEVVARLPDPERGYQAARHGAVLMDLSFRELLEATGPDRVTFLHGMVSNDVKGRAEGTACYTALLTAKGAMVADARLLFRPEAIFLDVEPGLGAKVFETLDRYLISEEVELRDVSTEWGMLALGGPRASTVLEKLGAGPVPPADTLRELAISDVRVLAVGNPSWVANGTDLLVPREGLEAVWRALLEAGAPEGLLPIDLGTWEQLRVEAGIPRYGADLNERTLPMEANLDRALCFDKGCYLGQEVVARVTFRGHVNRKLVGLLLGNEVPAPSTELLVGEQKVGWLTSVVRAPALGQNIGLGYVRREHLEPGTALRIAGTEAEARVHALPFVPTGSGE